MNTPAPNLESPCTKTVQRMAKIRRDCSTRVANETIEDYALRSTPRSCRKWSISRAADTAFGAGAFLRLQAIGGTYLHFVDIMRVHAQRFALEAMAGLP